MWRKHNQELLVTFGFGQRHDKIIEGLECNGDTRALRTRQLRLELAVEEIDYDRVVATQMPSPRLVGHVAQLLHLRVVGAVERALVERLLAHAIEVFVQEREKSREELLRVLLLEAAKVGVLLADQVA